LIPRLPITALSAPAILALASLAASCGGGAAHANSSSNTPAASGNNVQAVIVSSGPAKNYANGIFTSVTVCVPSSSTCQSIDGILVDTGSYGLRLLSSAGGGALTLSLPPQKGPTGNPVSECAAFVSGFTWGPVVAADISIAGERAANIPMQVIDPTFATVPSQCSNIGVPEDDSMQTLGANGILGVGPYVSDCGGACEQSGSLNPALYYECASSSCSVISEKVARQVQNPVASFAADNNGVMLQLPQVTVPAASISGSLIFGIGTQSNNGLGSATLFPLDASGEFSTTYKGQSYPAFIDSGSNAFFFLDAGLSGLAVCSDNSGFYCPPSQTSFTAQTTSGATTQSVNFSVVSADKLFSTPANFVFPTLAGPNPGTFDWGLPFFFGRNVFTAIESRSTPAGVGPFWAY
jgi:hypothetical protein